MKVLIVMSYVNILNQLVIVHRFVFLWVVFLIKVISCKPWLVLIELYGQEVACDMYCDNKLAIANLICHS